MFEGDVHKVRTLLGVGGSQMKAYHRQVHFESVFNIMFNKNLFQEMIVTESQSSRNVNLASHRATSTAFDLLTTSTQ